MVDQIGIFNDRRGMLGMSAWHIIGKPHCRMGCVTPTATIKYIGRGVRRPFPASTTRDIKDTIRMSGSFFLVYADIPLVLFRMCRVLFFPLEFSSCVHWHLCQPKVVERWLRKCVWIKREKKGKKGVEGKKEKRLLNRVWKFDQIPKQIREMCIRVWFKIQTGSKGRLTLKDVSSERRERGVSPSSKNTLSL